MFGQPPRQNLFPGIEGTEIMEEDVEDILDEGEKGVHTNLTKTSSLPDTIDIYDSLRMKRTSTHVIKQCGLLLNSQEKTIFLRAMQAQQQSGGSDCGLFAICKCYRTVFWITTKPRCV